MIDRHSRRRALALAALSLACALASGPVAAQTYPLRPVRMVVPFPAGGGTDIVARILAARMSELWGQQVVVDNRAGANGIVGTEAVVKSAPDGYTVLMGTMGNFAINPSVYKSLPFSIERDLAPISTVVTVPLMLVVHPSVPARTIAEYVAYAKANPGKVTYGSSGTGGGPHLAGELFSLTTGSGLVHVPYKGSGPAYNDLLGGQVASVFDSVVQGLQYVRTGKLRALAVLGARRSELLPETPTVAETFAGYDVTNWYAIMVPAAMPVEARRRLHATMSAALGAADIKKKLLEQGAEPNVQSPEEFGQFLARETKKWAELVRAAKIQPE